MPAATQKPSPTVTKDEGMDKLARLKAMLNKPVDGYDDVAMPLNRLN